MRDFRIFFVPLRIYCIGIVLLALVIGISSHSPSVSAKANEKPAPSIQGHPHFMKTRRAAAIQGAATTLPLVYHNGQVMQEKSTLYAIFWIPPTLPDGTATYYSTNYKFLLNQYFGDVGGSSLYNNNTQYYDNFLGHIKNSSNFGGFWIDNVTPYPTPSDCTDTATSHGCLIDTDIQTEITHALSVQTGWTTGLNTIFFVFTGCGEGSCDDSSSQDCAFTNYCGYHNVFTPQGQTQPILYANIPYPGTDPSACEGIPATPNNDIDSDSAISISSHEQMETVTDPMTPGASQSGWWDLNPNPPPNQDPHEEIGDKCAWQFGAVTLDGGKANVQWNGHYYIVQEEWSNYSSTLIGSGCTLAETSSLLKGTVYVGSANDTFYAFNAGFSSLRWSYQTGSEILSSPVVANGIVYIGSFGLYALNATNGSLIWHFTGCCGLFSSSPAVVNGIVYIGSNGQYFYALNAKTGKIIWQYKFPSGADSYGSPVVVNGVVYIAANGSLYALNASNGSLIWTEAAYGSPTTPVVVNGVMYLVIDTGYYQTIAAVNTSNGSRLWTYSMASSTDDLDYDSSVAVANGIVYAGSDGGYVYAVNASNGTLVWQYKTGGQVDSLPAIGNPNRVYVGSDDYNLYAIRANNGSLFWKYQTGGVIHTGPVVAAGMVFFDSADGYLYALNISNGSLFWQQQGVTADTVYNEQSSPVISLVGY